MDGKKVTAFPYEAVLLYRHGCHLCLYSLDGNTWKPVIVKQRTWTDYPIVYADGRVACNYPELFPQDFLNAVRRRLGHGVHVDY